MIFVHSSFRVASTWLWSRFRQAEGTVAYCEIFNEQLAAITCAAVERATPASWYSKHPATAPYFLEFLPFIGNAGGVAGFNSAMAFARFVPPDGPAGDIGADEQAYIASLIAHADGLGKVPVLTATRSLGRTGGIRRAFPGLHIVLYRNMFRQWCSYAEQYGCNNPYFLDTLKRTIEDSGHDRFLRVVHDLWPFEQADPADRRQFLAFAAVHAYLYAHAVNAADLVIDIDRLANEPAYRSTTEQRIRAASGLTVDLAGARTGIAYSTVDAGTHTVLAEALRPMLDLALSMTPGGAGQKFAVAAIDAMVGEYARYAHYTSSLAAVLAQVRAERADLAQERERLIGARDSLAAEREQLIAERNITVAERDRRIAERNALAVDRDRRIAERDLLAAERDGLLRSTS